MLTLVPILTCTSVDYVQGRIQDFPKGDANAKREASTYYLANCSWKLHGNYENGTEGHVSNIFLCRSATDVDPLPRGSGLRSKEGQESLPFPCSSTFSIGGFRRGKERTTFPPGKIAK